MPDRPMARQRRAGIASPSLRRGLLHRAQPVAGVLLAGPGGGPVRGVGGVGPGQDRAGCAQRHRLEAGRAQVQPDVDLPGRVRVQEGSVSVGSVVLGGSVPVGSVALGGSVLDASVLDSRGPASSASTRSP